MASINVLNLWLYLECVRARLDVYGIILEIRFNLFLYQEWMELSFLRTKMSFRGVKHPVLIEKERDISHVQYAADFSTNWILV